MAQDVKNFVENGFVYEDMTKETLIRYEGNSSNVEISNKVKVIRDGAFSGNKSVVSVTIPSSVTTIDHSIFYNCPNLQTVDLSRAKGITSISSYMFQQCSSLKNIELPAWITRIGEQAFYECSSLQSIAIPASTSTISNYAFYNCANLTNVDFSKAENLTYLGQYAFYNCPKLASLDLSGAKKLTTLKYSAFYNCDGFQEIKFPAGLTTIESSCFQDCNGLKKVTIPESVTSIGGDVFRSCSNLETVDLSKAAKLSSITSSSFAYCTKLTEIKISSQNKYFTSFDGALYNKDKTKIICWPAGKTDLNFPVSVTTIGANAFSGNMNLTKVTIPRQITSIGSQAFYGCSKLITVDFSAANSLTSIGSFAFGYCTKLTKADLSGAKNLTSIGEYAFYGCHNMETVDLSQSAKLETIDGAAFGDCSKVKELNISSRNENFASVDGVLYSKDKTKLVYWPLGKTPITIPSSVTYIGGYAFYGNQNLEKLEISKQITTIGQYAFAYCSNLESIDFSNAENLKTIGTGAFLSCQLLTEITIPNSVNTIGNEAFRYCYELKTVSIGSGLTNISSNNIFEDCNKIETVYFNNNSSSARPFYNKSSLKTVVAGDKVTYIPANAFAYCYNLESVDLSQATKLTSIGNSAFGYCGSLTELLVPSSVKSIGNNMIVGCSKLKFNEYEGARYLGNKTNKYVILISAKSSDITECRIPDETKAIAATAFNGCTKLKNLTIGSGVTSIDKYTFSSCPIETLTYNTNAIGTMFNRKSSLKTVNVGNKVTNIATDAFSRCSNLQTLNLSNAKKLETIGDNAFYNTQLTTLSIPEEVTSIGECAFTCQNLKTVDFSNAKKLTTINSYAFQVCAITEITIPETVTSIGEHAFRCCSQLTKVDLSKAKNLKTINNATFILCTNLKTVILGSGITSIAADAFYNCDNIENLTYNSNGIGTMYSWGTSLKTLNIGDNVTAIAANEFADYSDLTSIKIGKGVTSVGEDAFEDCDNITSIITESNADFSNSGIFFYKDGFYFKMLTKNTVELTSYGSDKMKIPSTVTLGNTFKVTKIGDRAFENCEELTSLIIPETVTRIDQRAFAGCTNLTEIKLGKGLKGNFKIGDKAFAGCNNIESVVIEGDNLSLLGGELYFIKDGIRYNVLYQNVVAVAPNNYTGNVVIPATVEAGDTYKVREIGDKAFKDCSGLVSIDLSKDANLEYIGWQAFSNCDGLTKITIPESVTGIDDYAFSGCDNLETVDLSKAKNLVNIYNYAFYNCYNLQTLDLSNNKSLEYIGDYAFYECYGLTEITIPESVTTIGSKAFYGCDGLLKVDLSNAKSLTRIENEAFYSCDNLAELDLENAESLNFIGNWAIAYCPSLESIIIPKSVKNMGSYVFRQSSNISPILCEAASKPLDWAINWNWNGYQVIWHYNNIKVNLSVNNSEWGTVSGAGTYTYGEDVHIKATPAKGYTFAGWSDNTPFDDFIVPAMNDIDITAIFYKVTECVVGNNSVYLINGEYGNCEFTPTISGTYNIHAESSSEPYFEVLDSNWSFLDWSFNSLPIYLEAGKKYYIYTEMDYSDADYFNLVIDAPQYIIEGKAKNGKVTGVGGYNEGDYVYLEAIPDPYYHFVKWSDGRTFSWREFTAHENATYTAEFELDTYEIAASASNATVEGTGEYAHGSEVTLTVKPDEGYEFLNWVDGSTKNPRKVTALESVTYSAEIGIKWYTVNCAAQHATVYGLGEYTYNTSLNLSAVADANYEIVDWRDKKGNVLATGTNYSFNLTKNTDIVLNVKGVDCAINASMENGTVEGTGSHEYGTTVTLTAKPQPGYKFTGWEDGETSATRTFTVTKPENLTAQTALIDYTVQVSSNDPSKGTASCSASTFNYNQVATIEAQAIGENKFVRWSDGNTSATRNITIQRDWNLTAVFSDQSLFVISATAEANGNVLGAGRYADGETATLSAYANPGYKFKEWSDGNTDAVREIKVTGSKELTAKFEIETYTLTVAAGANGTATGSGSFTFGAEAKLTATANAGYHFERWSDGNTNAERTLSVSGNTTLTAEFAINTYNVKATAKNGKVEGAGTYNHGAEATLTATAATGYHFTQWSDGNTDNPRKATVTSDMNIEAEFAINSYAITAAAQNGTVSGAGTYNYGAVATLIATAADGYHFTQWSDGVLSSQRSEIVTEDRKYTAEFEIDAYNVSAMAQNGSVDGTGIYNYGAEATLTATADQGYYFTQWSDGVKTKTRTETVTGSISLKAEFEVSTYTISAAEAANGSVSGAGTYNYGALATVTAIADEGYHFTQWSDGVTSETRRLTVVEDAEFSASFEINTYEVKLSAENGTVSGAGTFNHGEKTTISAKADSHYHFVRWSDGNTDNPRTLTVTRSRNLTAQFEADLYTIKVAAENGTIYGASASLEFGAVATLNAMADFGYHFVKWSDGNTDNPRSVTIDATVLSNIDKPFTAIFEKDPEEKLPHVAVEDEAAAGVNIYAYGNTIVVENADADIFVFDAMGRMITREIATIDRTEIQVEGTGVYVVKTGNTSKRVMIK